MAAKPSAWTLGPLSNVPECGAGCAFHLKGANAVEAPVLIDCDTGPPLIHINGQDVPLKRLERSSDARRFIEYQAVADDTLRVRLEYGRDWSIRQHEGGVSYRRARLILSRTGSASQTFRVSGGCGC
jgi:hypothetical protein